MNPFLYYLNSDGFQSPYFSELSRWIRQDLGKVEQDVTECRIEQDPIEMAPSPTFYRTFVPGNEIRFTLTFADGTQATKAFKQERVR